MKAYAALPNLASAQPYALTALSDATVETGMVGQAKRVGGCGMPAKHIPDCANSVLVSDDGLNLDGSAAV